MQVIIMRLNDEKGLENFNLLQLVEKEISSDSNLVVKKRALELLKKLSDF